MADIFISYSSQDKVIAKQLAALLGKKGWSVWWDRQIPIGRQYDTVIENELHNAGCVIVIWTKHSVVSEWVKNEAIEASQKNKLLPIVLEDITLPLAFKRTESAMLIDWNGEQDHPELEVLYHSIENTILNKNDINGKNDNFTITTDNGLTNLKSKLIFYGSIAFTGFIASMLLVYNYLHTDLQSYNLLLILFGISMCFAVFGAQNCYRILKKEKQAMKYKIAGPIVGIILIILGSFFIPHGTSERTVTIRVFDWKKNPVTRGDVKIYLKEYIRNQSIDKMGQALFTGIPANMPDNKIKIEISSPGYSTKVFDTTLIYAKPLEITLPLTTVVVISGKIKTAAEMPISEVEIDVDGTKYFAKSITDGTYSLRLEEYTLGDEITLTTSHKDFEDKTVSLTINSPEIINQDIFLNPIKN